MLFLKVGEILCLPDHEAYTQMSLHILDVVSKGAHDVLITTVDTVDTDVVVILVGILNKLVVDYPDIQLWVAFGKGKHFRYYHIINLCLSKHRCKVLPFFHAFTGSYTFQFGGKQKKSAWKLYPAATDAFSNCMNNPFVTLA